MLTKYEELFRIRCQHAYFGNGVCHALELTPTADCLRLLDRHNCLFEKAAWGGIVHSEAGQAFGPSQPFTFALHARKTELAYTTDVAAERSVYYFDNLASKGEGPIDGDAFSLLNVPADAFAAIPWQPPRFNYSAACSAVDVVDVLGKQVLGCQTPIIDLGPLPEGRYQLRTSLGDPYDFYFTRTPAFSVWAFISIFPDVPSTRYLISIPARKSMWRYYIVSRVPGERSYEGCRIACRSPKSVKPNGIGSITFTPPKAGRLNGRAAWIVESAAPIPLYEYPAEHHAFKLSKKGQDDGVPIAYANAENTRLETADDGTLRYWSEIYLYV